MKDIKDIMKVDYPLKKSKRLKDAFEPGKDTGFVAVMSPKEFLNHANRLPSTKEHKDLISSFKKRMEKGEKFKAPKLLENNRADGRHRATAAEQLGIEKIPVIDYRDSDLDHVPKGIHSVPKNMKKIRKERKSGGAINYNVPTRLPIPGEDPEAMFRRLIEFSFAVGRQYRADGGPVEEPSADASRFVREEIARPEPAEQARINEITRRSPMLDKYLGYGAREAVEANVPRAMPTAHEFVQHQLRGNEPQLPQMDREAYQAMKEYSTLPLQMAAYDVPVAGQVLAAVDLARGIRNIGSGASKGDDMETAAGAGETALAATGARGKLAKAAAAGMAGLMPDEARASFFSEAAHMSPAIRKALEAAKRAVSEGASPSEAWMQHGWAPDPSGKMVSELSDAGARLIPEGLAAFRAGEKVKLGELLSHPEMYDLYPRSYTREVVPFYKDMRERGYYNPIQDTIGSNIRLRDRDLLENLLHEHQHRIQHIEGMSPGTNPDVMMGPEEVARPFIDQRNAIKSALELQKIMQENPGMKYIDAVMVAKERNIPVATGIFDYMSKPRADLLSEMDDKTDLIEKTLSETPSKYDQYFRSLGEWTARLPGERLEMTEGQRFSKYPFPENFPVIVRPPSANFHENPRQAMWEAERDRAIELSKKLQQDPLPPKFGIEPEKDWDLEEDLMKMAQEIEARKRAGFSDPLGPVVPPTKIPKAGGGVITKALGKLLPAGSGYVPRKGFAANVNLPGFGSVEARPIQPIEDVARKFLGAAHDEDVTPLNPEFAGRVAEAYEAMKHDPGHPDVRRAYDALADETLAQYRAAKDLGLDIRFLKEGERDPYAASPALGYEDLVNRGRLFVFPTEQGFGSSGGLPASNPLLKRAGKIGDKPDAVVNDAFRVIHDLYGHYGPGNPFFRAPGEERAYQLHSRMFSPEARGALTSETRGQNSWVNFGPFAERNRAATGETTHYADQKAGLMPRWTQAEPPAENADVGAYIRSLRGYDKGGVVSSALQAIAKSVPYAERMAVMHQMSPLNLKKAESLGAFPSPSLGVGKPALNPLTFGKITLVGKPHLADPSAENPIFGQDVWTPRVPRVEEYNHNEFKGPGFYSYAKKKDVPATPENIVEHMNSLPIIGGEYLSRFDEEPLDLGYVTSKLTPRFQSKEEILGARNRLIPYHEWERKAEDFERTHTDLAERLAERRSALDEDPADSEQFLNKMILALHREKTSPAFMGKTSHLFYPRIKPEEKAELEQHMQNISEFPTRYFEAKPRRVVRGEEFAGAVVPQHLMEEYAPSLKSLGISKIVPHYGEPSSYGTNVLENFPEQHFDRGGLAKALDVVKRIPIERAREMVASPFSESPESVQRALDYARSLRVSQGEERLPGSFYNIMQSRPVSEVTSRIEDLPGVKALEPRQSRWEDILRDYKGGTLFNVAGDRSNLGRMTHINEEELAWPVDLHAGPKYMLEPNEGLVWANNPAHASGFQRAIAEAAKRGPVLGAYHPMGVQSVDSSHNMIDALLAQIARGDISKKNMRAVDKMLRRGEQAEKKNVGLASEAMTGWPGLEHGQEASEFARGLEGTRRSEIVKFLDKAPFLKQGFPAVGETRVAITDPALRGAPGNMLGHRIVELKPESFDPSGSLAFTHSTYASPTAGKYVGDVPLVQSQYVMPDVERDLMTKLAKGDRVVHPYSPDPRGRASWRKSLETRKLGQEINQEMLDSIMRGMERQGQYGFADGGPVIDDDFDVLSDLPHDAGAGTPE